MELSPKEVWWKYVPASRLMVKAAARDLTDNGLSLQLAPYISPWKEQFEDDLRDCIDRYGFGIDLRDLNGADLTSYNTLLDGIVHALGIDKGYDGSIISASKNLPESGCIVWLHELSASQKKQCFELCGKLSTVSGKGGSPRFHLIFESDNTSKHKGVKLIENCNSSRSNIRYFVYRLLMEAELGKLTEYAVAVVIEAAGEKIEACGDMCLRIMEESFDAVLSSLAADSNSFYSLHRAQIRTVEPLVQIGRLLLCEKYADQIKQLLPFCDDFGTTINEPHELELRHLWHYKSKLCLSASDDAKLRLLYDARNDLSHQRILSYQTICNLIDDYQ